MKETKESNSMGGVTRDMNIPENYEKLGKAGFTPKGAWSNTETYSRLDIVYYKGSSYIVVNDGVNGVTPSETNQNYIIMAAGQEEEETLVDDLQNVDMLGKFTRIVDYGAGTANTPYTAGLSTCTSGTAIINGDPDNWCTIWALSCAGNEQFMCFRTAENTWSSWDRVITDRDKVLMHRGVFDGDQDINATDITPGCYEISANAPNGLPQNWPQHNEWSAGYGIFVQFHKHYTQLCITDDGIATRTRTGNPMAWNNWHIYRSEINISPNNVSEK